MINHVNLYNFINRYFFIIILCSSNIYFYLKESNNITKTLFLKHNIFNCSLLYKVRSQNIKLLHNSCIGKFFKIKK
jgi:hypothetical protein